MHAADCPVRTKKVRPSARENQFVGWAGIALFQPCPVSAPAVAGAGPLKKTVRRNHPNFGFQGKGQAFNSPGLPGCGRFATKRAKSAARVLFLSFFAKRPLGVGTLLVNPRKGETTSGVTFSESIRLPMPRLVLLTAGLLLALAVQAQEIDSDSLRRLENFRADTLFIGETEAEPGLPQKVLHAEPLFIDLIRDLGARRGEAEWNVGLGMTDAGTHSRYDGLIEYEFAPVHRLGLEVEVPFSVHRTYRSERGNGTRPPADRIEGLKLAAQYSFFVSERLKTSAALGYIHTLKAYDFEQFGPGKRLKGQQHNPFLVVARRWGTHVHTLVYTGPSWERPRAGSTTRQFAFHSNLHYMIPGTRNFVGLEVNKQWTGRDFDATFRPQLRLGITDNLLLGIVAAIPARVERERFGSFMRLIYEPRHRKA